MKFSVSECLPLNVIGFSNLTFNGWDKAVRCTAYGTFCYYYIALAPASPTGYCKNYEINAG